MMMMMAIMVITSPIFYIVHFLHHAQLFQEMQTQQYLDSITQMITNLKRIHLNGAS